MASGPVVVGSTYLWRTKFLRDGAIYDLTGATITISFQPPSGAVQTFSMSPSSPTEGIAEYTNTTALFTGTQDAQWNRSYKVTKSGIVLESQPIPFKVYRSVSGS